MKKFIPFNIAIFAELGLYAVGFNACANLLALWEQINNYKGNLSLNEILFTGANYAAQSYSTNLFNEGLIGYGLLALVGGFAFVFCRKLIQLHNMAKQEVQSLYHSEQLTEGVNI